MKRKFTDADIDRISIMRDAGKTTREIAEAFGMSKRSMQERIRKLIKRGELGSLKEIVRWGEDEEAKLIQLKAEGISADKAAKQFGASAKILYHHVGYLVRRGKLPREFLKWARVGLSEYLDERNLCHMCYKREKSSCTKYCAKCLESMARRSQGKKTDKPNETEISNNIKPPEDFIQNFLRSSLN